MTKNVLSVQLFHFLKESHPDSKAIFEKIYSRYYSRVFGYLIKKGLTEPEAQDLSQNIFIQLFEKRERYRAGTPADAWVFVVARSLVLDYFRKQKRQLKLTHDFSQFLLSQTESSQAYSDEGRLNDLSPEDFKMLQDRFERGLSFSEMSQEWGLSSDNLRKKMSRLYKRLQKTARVHK